MATFSTIAHLLSLGIVPSTFTQDDVNRLAADIMAIADEDPAWMVATDEALIREWLRRLGGRQNCGPFLACLRAGDRRRVEHAAFVRRSNLLSACRGLDDHDALLDRSNDELQTLLEGSL